MPQVTVLMPVYNAAPYLAEAVESILHQTFADFEFLIINDGSTDGSLEILQRYAALDSRIHLVSRENRGFVATLNEGIALARAPLIARMDADDISMPDRLELQATFMVEHPETAVVGTHYDMIDEKGRVIGHSGRLATCHDEILSDLLNGTSGISNTLFRRDVVREAGGYNPKWLLIEDHELWIRVSELGRLATMEDVLFQYRIHALSLCGATHQKQIATKREMLRHARTRHGMCPDCEVRPWRPTTRKQCFEEYRRRWWFGITHSNRGMALDYAWQAIRTMTFRPHAWWLLVRAIAMKSKQNGQARLMLGLQESKSQTPEYYFIESEIPGVAKV